MLLALEIQMKEITKQQLKSLQLEREVDAIVLTQDVLDYLKQ